MSEDIHEIAAQWHASQSNDDMDWDGFTRWLEADARHRAAYDDIALIDDRIDRHRDLLARLVTMPTERPVRRSRWQAMRRPAIAAVAAVVVAIGSVHWLRQPEPVATTEYAAGKTVRQVALADGSTATLAPGSILTASVDRTKPMTLVGRAHFDVRHDATSPMVIAAGGYEIRDVGTRFDVTIGSGAIDIAVAEGSVAVASATVRGVMVRAGQRFTVAGGTDPRLGPVRTATVGRWRSGPLVYDATPLAIVAADIARTTGLPVEAVGAVAARPFSGVIAPGDRSTMVNSVAALTGVDSVVEGDTLRLRARDRR